MPPEASGDSERSSQRNPSRHDPVSFVARSFFLTDYGPDIIVVMTEDSTKLDIVEREFRAMLAKMTGGIAPQDYGAAFWDWWLNLAKSPEKQAELHRSP